MLKSLQGKGDIIISSIFFVNFSILWDTFIKMRYYFVYTDETRR